ATGATPHWITLYSPPVVGSRHKRPPVLASVFGGPGDPAWAVEKAASMEVAALERQRGVVRQRAAGKFRREQVAAVAQPREFRGKVDKAVRDHMDHEACALQAAAHGEETRRHHGAAVFGK